MTNFEVQFYPCVAVNLTLKLSDKQQQNNKPDVMRNWAALWRSNKLGILLLVSHWGSTTPAERTRALWATCKTEHNSVIFILLDTQSHWICVWVPT